MTKKKKVYVLTVSEYFPKGHNSEGQETGFVQKILNGEKIHTIRKNFSLWEKRIKKVQSGEAILSVRIWTGRPYNSPQKEVAVFEDAGVELLQKDYDHGGWFITGQFKGCYSPRLSNHDGLNTEDFNSWFSDIKPFEPLAIIHFTKFRYLKSLS